MAGRDDDVWWILDSPTNNINKNLDEQDDIFASRKADLFSREVDEIDNEILSSIRYGAYDNHEPAPSLPGRMLKLDSFSFTKETSSFLRDRPESSYLSQVQSRDELTAKDSSSHSFAHDISLSQLVTQLNSDILHLKSTFNVLHEGEEGLSTSAQATEEAASKADVNREELKSIKLDHKEDNKSNLLKDLIQVDLSDDSFDQKVNAFSSYNIKKFSQADNDPQFYSAIVDSELVLATEIFQRIRDLKVELDGKNERIQGLLLSSGSRSRTALHLAADPTTPTPRGENNEYYLDRMSEGEVVGELTHAASLESVSRMVVSSLTVAMSTLEHSLPASEESKDNKIESQKDSSAIKDTVGLPESDKKSPTPPLPSDAHLESLGSHKADSPTILTKVEAESLFKSIDAGLGEPAASHSSDAPAAKPVFLSAALASGRAHVHEGLKTFVPQRIVYGSSSLLTRKNKPTHQVGTSRIVSNAASVSKKSFNARTDEAPRLTRPPSLTKHSDSSSYSTAHSEGNLSYSREMGDLLQRERQLRRLQSLRMEITASII